MSWIRIQNDYAYRIRFTTWLTGDAAGQKIQNRVYMNDKDGKPADSYGGWLPDQWSCGENHPQRDHIYPWRIRCAFSLKTLR